MSECKNKFITSKYLEDPRIKEANTAMHSRLRMLGIFAIFVILLIYFIIAFAMAIYDSIANYYALTKNNDAKTTMNGRAAIASSDFDNEQYGDQNGEELVDEYNEFKRNMAKVKEIYSDYNQKVTEYHKSLEKEPTDIIDEKLMLREFDEY